MSQTINKLIYWAPRVLSILFVIFLFLMSLDVFDGKLDFWQTLFGLFIHNIPALVLLLVIIISWKYEIVGGIVFILAGLLYIWLISDQIFNNFQWYYLSWIIQISGVAFFIGALFLIGWFRKKK